MCPKLESKDCQYGAGYGWFDPVRKDMPMRVMVLGRLAQYTNTFGQESTSTRLELLGTLTMLSSAA
jgi:hypothetical protein